MVLSFSACKCNFINSTLLENQKDRLPSLKLLEQRVHELVGGKGALNPPPPLDNVVGSKRLRSGWVKLVSTCSLGTVLWLTPVPAGHLCSLSGITVEISLFCHLPHFCSSQFFWSKLSSHKNFSFSLLSRLF